jgi:hypothetical protein
MAKFFFSARQSSEGLLQAANKVIEKTLSGKASPPKQVLQQQLQKKQLHQDQQQKKQLQQDQQQKKQQQQQAANKAVGANQHRLDQQQKLKKVYEVRVRHKFSYTFEIQGNFLI